MHKILTLILLLITISTLYSQEYTVTQQELVLRGQADPNSIIEVYVDDSRIGEVPVDETGSWQFNNFLISKGKHSIKTRSLNKEGIYSNFSKEIIVNIRESSATTDETTAIIHKIDEESYAPMIAENIIITTHPQTVKEGKYLSIDVKNVPAYIQSISATFPNGRGMLLKNIGANHFRTEWRVPKLNDTSFFIKLLLINKDGNGAVKMSKRIFYGGTTTSSTTLTMPSAESKKIYALFKKKNILPPHWKEDEQWKKITRIEWAYIVAKLKKMKTQTPGRNPARDVAQSHWGAGVITPLANAGIMELKGEYFYPNKPVSRAYTLVTIIRAGKYNFAKIKKSPYKDVATNHWAAKYIVTAKKKNITTKTQYFYPAEHCTRESALIFAYRSNLI
ncbi:S-layer homology domain-containing protein [Candidatus Margulisiibacteriota bacterium]